MFSMAQVVGINSTWRDRYVAEVSGVWAEVGSQVVAEVNLLTCESSELHRFCLAMEMQQ